MVRDNRTAATPLSVTWGTQSGKARLEVVQRISGETVRVTVVIDPSYAAQSAAFAEVLTPAKTWTQVVSIPASVWHRSVAYVDRAEGDGRERVTDAPTVPTEVHELELDLFVKAAAILGL